MRHHLHHILGVLLMGVILCASALAHTTQIRACLHPDGSVTFYAGVYDNLAHGTPPIGGITIDGTEYPFTSVIPVGDLPPCATYGDAEPCFTGLGPVAIWQVVTVPGLAGGTYSVSTTCYDALECPACSPREMTFPAVVCGKNSNKVIICHQTSSGPQTLCVALSSLPAHMAHGDYLGACATPKSPIEGSVTEFRVAQNYPNPFNPTTSISYDVPTNAFVSLRVFNEAGKEVATLVEEFRSEGRYTVTFDASDLASGTYFYRFQSGAFVKTLSMTLSK